MNKEDSANLGFLMGLPEEEFDRWMNSASGKDIDYALELIRLARSESIIQEFELLDSIDGDLTEAKNIIHSIKMMIGK